MVSAAIAYSWEPALPEIAEAGPFAPEAIARGEMLARAGYCGTCHTTDPTRPFAGGRGLETGFGTIFTTNITPDRDTGIGGWSEAAFDRAMRAGVSRDGSHLFPAFPYDHFSGLSDGDVKALYAYFMTRAAVSAKNKDDTIPFPLNIRLLQAGWKFLFFHSQRVDSDVAGGIGRGRYLVETLSHCGACHTPRNSLGAEKADAKFSGASIDGWYAPPLTSANPSPIAWSAEELYAYLRSGGTPYHGSAGGPMSPVIHGLDALPDSDIEAIAEYIGSLKPQQAKSPEEAERNALELDRKTSISTISSTGERLYATACATCHYNGAAGVNVERPELGLNTAVFADTPDNLLHVILEGISTQDGLKGVAMPSFANGLSDADIVSIAQYLRSTRTPLPPWPDLETKVKNIRASGTKHD
ncbi:c-type cytochrome [Rhizobium mesosinicum]|uniref:c-type cytochrome n=1 Tax=Rhizobium mesosinicum TaxID=335017 RepID=UPI001CB7917A|nr:cytochrome c [Rhizobium mesosinicum]